MGRGIFNLGWSLAGLLSFGGAAWADDLTTLNTAYMAFCKEAQPQPGAIPAAASPECLAQTRQGVRWLRLDLYCGCDSSRQPACPAADTKSVCGDFSLVRSQLEPLVLAYDHAAGTWNAGRQLDPKRVKRDVNGRPTVSLAPEEDLIVVIEKTNPLLYAVSRGTVTEAPTPEVVQLQKLAGLLGGGIQSLLTSLADSAGAQTGSSFKDYLDKLKPSLDALSKSQARVGCLLRQATEQRARIVAFLQAIELGQAHEFPLSPRACDGGNVGDLGSGEVARAFEDLDRDAFAGIALDPGCPTVLAAALKVLTSDGAKPADVRAAVNDFRATRGTEVCHEDLRMAVEGLDTNTFAELLMARDSDLPNELAANASIRLQLQTTLALALKWKSVVTAATTLAGERDNAGKAVAAIVGFGNLLRANVTAAPAPCSDTSVQGRCQTAQSVDRRLFLEPNAKPVQWDTIQTHPISVKVVSPFAASVIASRPSSVDTSLSLDSVQRGLWGVGGSVIWTSLKSPTFGAVTDPDHPTQMIIAETDQEARAGGLALLVNYRVGRRYFPQSPFGRSFGLEFGAPVDTAKPGFFGGISFQLGKYVRLGGGLTYQRIKALRDQNLGDVVKAAGDIKMRQKFEESAYISLSIAIESVRLFNVN